MIGAIAGDIIGSVYEHAPIKTKYFPLFHRQARFTDDTVLSVAVAGAILDENGAVPEAVQQQVMALLPDDLAGIVTRFRTRFAR